MKEIHAVAALSEKRFMSSFVASEKIQFAAAGHASTSKLYLSAYLTCHGRIKSVRKQGALIDIDQA